MPLTPEEEAALKKFIGERKAYDNTPGVMLRSGSIARDLAGMAGVESIDRAMARNAQGGSMRGSTPEELAILNQAKAGINQEQFVKAAKAGLLDKQEASPQYPNAPLRRTMDYTSVQTTPPKWGGGIGNLLSHIFGGSDQPQQPSAQPQPPAMQSQQTVPSGGQNWAQLALEGFGAGAQGMSVPQLHQAQAMAKLRQFQVQDQMRTQAAQQNYPQFAEKFKQFKQSTWKAYSDEKKAQNPGWKPTYEDLIQAQERWDAMFPSAAFGQVDQDTFNRTDQGMRLGLSLGILPMGDWMELKKLGLAEDAKQRAAFEASLMGMPQNMQDVNYAQQAMMGQVPQGDPTAPFTPQQQLAQQGALTLQRDILKSQAGKPLSLSQELSQADAAYFERTGKRLNADQVAKKLGAYVNERENPSFSDRVRQLKENVEAAGGVVTPANILQMAGAYQGTDKVSALQEKILYANAQVKSGLWTPQEGKKFIGALVSTPGQGDKHQYGTNRGDALAQMNELFPKIMDGTASEEENRKYQSLAAIAQTTNPDGTTLSLPPFLQGGIAQSEQNIAKQAQGGQIDFGPSPAAQPSVSPPPAESQAGIAMDPVQRQSIDNGFAALQQAIEMGYANDPGEPVARPAMTFYQMADLLTGPKSGIKGALGTNIVTSSFVDASDIIQARNAFSLFKNNLTNSLRENDRFVEGERRDIIERLDLDASIFEDPKALQSRIIGVDNFLAKKEQAALKRSQQQLSKSEVQAARNALSHIRQARATLIPPFVESEADLDAKLKAGELKPGDTFRGKNNQLFTVN